MEDEINEVNRKSLVLKWGAIGGLVGIIFFVVLDIAGLGGNEGLRWIGLLISVAVIFLAHKEFKEQGNGYLSFSQGLGIGTLVSLVSAVINSIFTFIYTSYINDSIIVLAREKAIMDLENSGQSDAEIDQAMGILEMMTSPMAFLILGLFMGVFFGFIISLIVSIFTKKSSPEFS